MEAGRLLKDLFKKRFLILFIVLMIPYLVHPFITTEALGITLLDISFTLVLFVGIFAVSGKKHVAAIAFILVLLAQALTWTTHAFSNQALILAGLTTTCLYLMYTAAVLLNHLAHSKSPTAQTIFCALCVYLLIGLIWAFFYSFCEAVHPGSFDINRKLFAYQPTGRHLFSQLYYFMYFSFTTLTTLGYGDILPAAPWTRVLASLEAMLGQLYLVVIVSQLVGLHIHASIVKETETAAKR